MNRYTVTRDGVTVATASSMLGAWREIHARVGYSIDHAMRHEGWDIVTPAGVSFAAEHLRGGE